MSVVVGTVLFQSASYTALLLLTLLMNFFFLPVDPLTENMNYRLSQQNGISYGAVRTFGALGYAAASLVVGLF